MISLASGLHSSQDASIIVAGRCGDAARGGPGGIGDIPASVACCGCGGGVTAKEQTCLVAVREEIAKQAPGLWRREDGRTLGEPTAPILPECFASEAACGVCAGQAQAALRKKDCSHDDITQACRKWVALAQVSVSECTWDDASQTMQVSLRGAENAQPTSDADYFELQISTGSWRRCSLADLAARAADVTAECCDEPTEDCSSGMPATCNAGCAAVLVPVKE